MRRSRYELLVHTSRWLVLLALPLAIAANAASRCAAAETLGLKVPEGFEVTRFADDSQAHDIFSLTFDAHGRVVVSGPGYIKILHDDQHIGRANRVTVFANVPVGGAQGMYFEGDDLICIGDNSVFRLHGENDRATNPQVAPSKPQMKEHGTHSVKKGPDGWFYYILGNDPGVSDKQVTTKSSPVVKPSRGAIVRFTINDQGVIDRSEVVADGFRNPYDFDFLAAGNILTVDSDNERDQYLPWYAPTRLFDVAQGHSHGWLNAGWQEAWNRPASYFDSVPRLCEIGRGSPTGGVAYRHRAFPEHYRGGYFSACWSLGKIYYFPLTPEKDGSSYTTKLETFCEATGASGFAPTGMAIAPDGDLYVAIGGRQTQGGVFRIHYRGAVPAPIAGGPLHEVLSADQPLASWSRANWLPKAKSLKKMAFEEAACDTSLTSAQRMRAIEILVELFDGLTPQLAQRAIGADGTSAEVVARAAWAISRSVDSPATLALLGKWTFAGEPRIQRAVWESVACSSAYRNLKDEAARLPVIKTMALPESARQADRRARTAAIDVIVNANPVSYRMAVISNDGPTPDLLRKELGFPDRGSSLSSEHSTWKFQHDVRKPDILFDNLRHCQILLGDVRKTGAKPAAYNGYESDTSQPIAADKMQIVVDITNLADAARDDAELDRELARTFAMLHMNDASRLAWCVKRISPLTSPVDDIHYLICLSQFETPWTPEIRRQVAHALVDLFAKMAARDWIPSRNWPDRVGELVEELCKKDPLLAKAIADDPDFELPEHSLLIKHMAAEVATYAARTLLTALQHSKRELAWTPELIDALSILPHDDLAPALRKRWENVGLRDSIAVFLAKKPQEEDRDRFRQTLGSVQAASVSSAAKALTKLKTPGNPTEIRAALQALRQFGSEPAQRNLRQDLAALLTHLAGEKIEVFEPAKPAKNSGDAKNAADAKTNTPRPLDAYQPWFDWFAKTYPDEAKKLASSGNVNSAAWFKRLDAINWDAGDQTRGQAEFQKLSCHRCHTGASKLGPDLTGAATRFNRRDLFEAIFDPSKDVAPPYRTTSVTDRNGQTVVGLMVYESPDATLLQTGPDTIVRLTGIDKQAMRPSRQSLMPTGLLNEASDQDLADLLAFLQSIKK